MTYPCGIIKDLLPLYIDDVCNEDSKKAVEIHLSECKNCRNYYESMKSTDGFIKKKNDNSEDIKMANSLKNVKLKINRKIRNIILCSTAAVLIFIIGFNLLFNAAIKEISPQDVLVSANVYSLSELIENPAQDIPDSESVTILSDENDSTEQIEVKIPELGKVNLTRDTLEECKYATVISTSSKYFLRTIRQETKGDTIYISAFKTTLLNNKAEDYQKSMKSLELKEINKIVFVDGKGTETTLWKK